MKPTDYRNATWERIKKDLTHMRLRVYNAWLEFGPGKTMDVAIKSGISILNLRPRTTDLFQMGLVRQATPTECCRAPVSPFDGDVYIAVPEEQFKCIVEARQVKQAEQSELNLFGSKLDIGDMETPGFAQAATPWRSRVAGSEAV